MKTLETMVKGTKVGFYAGFLYGIILVIASAIVFIVQIDKSIQQEHLITQKVASKYSVSEESAKNLVCFQGILHYRNKGALSGFLAFSPNISCSETELNSLKENPADDIATIAFVFLLLGLLMIVISYIELAKKDEGQAAQ
ncbi:hypothetical protein JCM30760_02530 [Thiomicrorhabdus hydrogeniphila]